jgi:WD40 repeat protein
MRPLDELFSLGTHEGYVNDVVITPDGHHFVNGVMNGVGRVFSTRTGKWTSTLVDSYFNSVAISSNGKKLIVGTYNGEIKFLRPIQSLLESLTKIRLITKRDAAHFGSLA